MVLCYFLHLLVPLNNEPQDASFEIKATKIFVLEAVKTPHTLPPRREHPPKKGGHWGGPTPRRMGVKMRGWGLINQTSKVN